MEKWICGSLFPSQCFNAFIASLTGQLQLLVNPLAAPPTFKSSFVLKSVLCRFIMCSIWHLRPRSFTPCFRPEKKSSRARLSWLSSPAHFSFFSLLVFVSKGSRKLLYTIRAVSIRRENKQFEERGEGYVTSHLENWIERTSMINTFISSVLKICFFHLVTFSVTFSHFC